MTQFVAVNQIDSNFWLANFNISNIGGMFGISYNSSNPNSNAFWVNSTANNPQFSVDFGPGPTDWSWISNAPNLTSEVSYLYVGGIDPKLNDYLKTDTDQVPIIIVANEFNEWSFEFGALTFGKDQDAK